MKLLNERFNDEVICNSFIDEFDRFDEFDLEWISKDYDERIICILAMYSSLYSIKNKLPTDFNRARKSKNYNALITL